MSFQTSKNNSIRSTAKKSKYKLKNKLTNKKLLLPLIFVVIFAGIGIYMLIKSLAVTPQGTYTHWNWSPPADGYSSLKHQLTVEAVTNDAPYFWSHQFQFLGGDGGYIGLQSRGNRINGTVGKTAIFSIFSSGIAATTGNCVVEQAGFDGYNTSGSSCRIPYEWVLGRTYELRTARLGSDAGGIWWGGYVKDTSTGAETLIGEIKVPSTWKGHNWWTVMWTEYFGPSLATCADLPYSKVRFSRPSANNGTIFPASTSNNVSANSECPSSKVTNVENGVVHEMGNTNFQPTDTSAPVVVISEPQQGILVRPGQTITISGSATDNVKVTAMEILVNGSAVKSSAGSSISTTWQVPAIKGKGHKSKQHTIIIKAKDAAGNTGSKSVNINASN